MYTIKQAASRSGVSVPLLRAWERRYGIVRPERTASGYRLYDDAAIARLRAMHLLVEEGWTPSNAAAHLREAGEPAVRDVLDAHAADEGVAAQDEPDGALAATLVSAARAMDEAALEAVLDDMFARGSFETAAGAHLLPALVRLGEAWERGELSVAAEHAAASAAARRLGSAFQAAGRPLAERELVLVGLPPGARHELGALAFATAARRARLAVRYLGADLPLHDWLAAAEQTSAVAAVIGVVSAADVAPARRVADTLRAARPGILIAFGGHAAPDLRLRDADLELRLPDALVAAVEALRSGMGRARSLRRSRGSSRG